MDERVATTELLVSNRAFREVHRRTGESGTHDRDKKKQRERERDRKKCSMENNLGANETLIVIMTARRTTQQHDVLVTSTHTDRILVVARL